MGMRVFENQANGHRETLSGSEGIFVFLFGPLYLLAKGLVIPAVVCLVLFLVGLPGGPGLALMFGFIANIGYAFCVNDLLAKKYLRNGWREVTSPDEVVAVRSNTNKISSANLGTRECPYCAEEIKAAAIKCKHCGSEVVPLSTIKTDVVDPTKNEPASDKRK